MYNYSKREFDIIRKNDPDNFILDFEEEFLKIYDKFMESGQSGGSAPYYASDICEKLKKLLYCEPISDINGDDSEWNLVGEPNMYQSNRVSRLFRDGKDDCPYYIDAVVFKEESGSCYTSSNVDGISSRLFIKEFPFVPKTFYVDVVSDGGIDKIKNINSLKPVFEHYSKDDKNWKKQIRKNKLKKIF